MWQVGLYVAAVVVGALIGISPWLVGTRQQEFSAYHRLERPVPMMPASEVRVTRWYRWSGLAGAALLGVAFDVVPLGGPAGWRFLLGLVAALTGATLGPLLVESLRHITDPRTPRAAAALRHVGLSDYVPMPFFVAALALPVATVVVGAVTGVPLPAVVVPLLLTGVAAGLAVWFVRQPERADSLAALWWRDARRSRLLIQLLLLPANFVYLCLGLATDVAWCPAKVGAAITMLALGQWMWLASVQRRFVRRLWPVPPAPPEPAPAEAEGRA